MRPDEEDPEGGEPLYLLLADRLERELAGLDPGSRVASENELAARHGVSRLTARAALGELERRFVVRRARGSGTFVLRRLDHPIGLATSPSSSEMIRRGGGRPSSVVASVRTRKPTASVRALLDLDPDERVVAVTRTGRVDEVPSWHGTTYLPLELVEGIVEHLGDDVSITAVLGCEFGIQPVLGAVRAELGVLPAEVAGHLGLEGRPLGWEVEVISHDPALGRPVLLAQRWLRADVFRLRLEAQAP